MSVYRPQERRLVLRLLAFWDDKRGDREYPSVRDIDPQAIGDDWPHCHILKLAEPVADSRFQYVGNTLLTNGMDAQGLTFAERSEQNLIYHATDYLDRMLQKGVPISIGGEADLTIGSVLFRSIMMPLSEDGSRIDHVFGGANYRLATAQDEAP